MFGATEGLLVGALLLATGGALWSRTYDRRRAGRRTRVALAQVVDVDAGADPEGTLRRVVLLFMHESGEPVAVGTTARFTREQLGALVPGHVVAIVHEPRAPENFAIDFTGALLEPAGARTS